MKKTLIPISILMSFVAPFASIANVGATANADGPWSFDELLSARTEFKARVDASCPRSSARAVCAEDIRTEIMEEVGGVVDHGIMQTEATQFLPVSIDFANDTLEYYYSSDNLRRNFDWHLPFKNILPTKLVLIQADAEYARSSGEWSDKIKESDQNPKWHTLYSGEIAEGEESLLVLNQKSTLSIAHPIFDSHYEKAIRGYIEYSTGEYFHFVFTFENTKDGRKYDSWFSMEELYPYFEDPSYNEGYQDGLNDGQNTGYSNGHSDGYNNGYENGYTDGYEYAYSVGHEEGFNNGYVQGLLEGQNESPNQTDPEDTTEPDDVIIPDSNPTPDDNQPTGQSTTQNNSFLSQSASNTINNFSLTGSSTTMGSALKKPDTGASTAENGSTEAEWWIGAILALGLFTLAWLFWPNRQKSPKNSPKALDKKDILR